MFILIIKIHKYIKNIHLGRYLNVDSQKPNIMRKKVCKKVFSSLIQTKTISITAIAI
jgi:hypothetical protein